MSLPNTESRTAEDVIDQPRAPASINKRFVGWCLYLVILCGAFALPLRAFVTYASWSDDFKGLVGGGAFEDATDGLSYGLQAEAWW